METANTLRRIFGIVTIALLLGSTLGCNKMLSKYSLSQAQKRLQEANANKADQFAPDLLAKTTSDITKAQNEYNSGNFTESRASAKTAAASASELLERTKVQRANFLKAESYRWLDIAKKNQAEQENPEVYRQVGIDDETGRKLIEKQKWDKAIQVFDKNIEQVKYLLKNLADKANAGLKETEKMRDTLTEMGANENAPEFVETITQQIQSIKDAIEKETDYRKAIALRDQARQTEERGIQRTKEVKSQKQIQEIENLLDEASNLGAEIYAAQNFTVISKDFDNLIQQFYEKNYDTVLRTTPDLKPKVEALIVETKRESARAKMQAVEKAINVLNDGQVKTYLPGRVEELVKQLDEARQLFDKQQYTESEKVSLRGLEIEQRIVDDFNALAQKHISEASDKLATAKNVYDTMQVIFDKVVPGPWTGDDKALEDSKKALKEELRTRVNNAQIELGLATLRREEKNFNQAIQIADKVAVDAQDVQEQTYRVVAHNAILEIANQLTNYERQGGRQYAADEMNKTNDLLEQSKQLLKDGKYRDAVRRAADTKAQLEIMVQELERVAVARINNASQALKEAREHKAEHYRNEELNQAIVALDRAKDSLQGEGLRQAIESATQAEQIASQASQKSLQQWAEELMRQIDLIMTKAQEAGANRYATDLIQNALDLRNQCKALYDQGKYVEAIDIGQKAVNTAHDALYAKVNEAESLIATAQRFEGWEFEHQRLAEAINCAKSAREDLDKGDYPVAEQFAAQAITVATNVIRDAKRKAFESRMETLESRLSDAEKKGTGYYQVKDLSRILAEMNALRNEFDPQSGEDYAQKVDNLDAQLAGLVEMTPDVINELLNAMQERLTGLESRNASSSLPDMVDEVNRKIKYARLDFKAEKFRPSFQNAKDAMRLLDTMELRLDERDFDKALYTQLKQFNEAIEKFRPVLDMGTTALIELAIGANGRAQAVSLLQASSPSDLRTTITEIGARVRMLKTPPSRVDIHESAVKMLTVAKTAAANFEKLLIMDMYGPDEARNIVQTAFVQMQDARHQEQDIQRTIPNPEIQFKPAGVERVVSSRE
ncbi:MAG: hypothetical protein M1457_11520 [bacterium]|nr:hypothetical protein [bacterium]